MQLSLYLPHAQSVYFYAFSILLNISSECEGFNDTEWSAQNSRPDFLYSYLLEFF
jgi:hypothetical protein